MGVALTHVQPGALALVDYLEGGCILRSGKCAVHDERNAEIQSPTIFQGVEHRLEQPECPHNPTVDARRTLVEIPQRCSIHLLSVETLRLQWMHPGHYWGPSGSSSGGKKPFAINELDDDPRRTLSIEGSELEDNEVDHEPVQWISSTQFRWTNFHCDSPHGQI